MTSHWHPGITSRWIRMVKLTVRTTSGPLVKQSGSPGGGHSCHTMRLAIGNLTFLCCITTASCCLTLSSSWSFYWYSGSSSSTPLSSNFECKEGFQFVAGTYGVCWLFQTLAAHHSTINSRQEFCSWWCTTTTSSSSYFILGVEYTCHHQQRMDDKEAQELMMHLASCLHSHLLAHNGKKLCTWLLLLPRPSCTSHQPPWKIAPYLLLALI